MKASFSNRADNIESAEQFVLLLASKNSSLWARWNCSCPWNRPLGRHFYCSHRRRIL